MTGASIGLIGTAWFEMRRHRTTVDPIDVGKISALVATGPYRFTRNPIYLGLAGMLASLAIARRSVAALLPIAGLVAAIDRVQIPAEEASLQNRFGDDYAAYRVRVPRWHGRHAIPRFG